MAAEQSTTAPDVHPDPTLFDLGAIGRRQDVAIRRGRPLLARSVEATCPRCGPVGRPLHGSDEALHCPGLECDATVQLLSDEERATMDKARRSRWERLNGKAVRA